MVGVVMNRFTVVPMMKTETFMSAESLQPIRAIQLQHRVVINPFMVEVRPMHLLPNSILQELAFGLLITAEAIMISDGQLQQIILVEYISPGKLHQPPVLRRLVPFNQPLED